MSNSVEAIDKKAAAQSSEDEELSEEMDEETIAL